MWFVTYLLKKGIISSGQFAAAACQQFDERVPLGRIALKSRKLTMKELKQILECQAGHPEPLGYFAVKLGFLSEDDVAILLNKQAEELRPLAEILVDQGALSREQVTFHLAEARRMQHHRFDFNPEKEAAVARLDPI